MNRTPSPEHLFHEAMSLDSAEERSRLVAATCGENDELRREVESLLAAYSEADEFLQPVHWLLDAEDVLREHLSGYDLLEKVGEGGMSTVYRARQVSLWRDVALKVLSPELSCLESFRQGFEKDARAMAKLPHPHLVGIHDFGSVHGLLYLVMEFVDGESLSRAAGGRKTDPAQAVELVAAVAAGLELAHDEGILHRDIKPSNILITRDLVAKLGDFGLAVPADNVASGLQMGTPAYSAPEVLANLQSASPASDVYSLGLILHQLLTGKTPTVGQAPDLDLIPPLRGLRTLVGKALASDPGERFPSGGILREALCSWLKAAPKFSPRLQIPPRSVRPCAPTHPQVCSRPIKSYQTGSGLTAVASAALLVLLAVLTILLHERPGENPEVPTVTSLPDDQPLPIFPTREFGSAPQANPASDFNLEDHRKDMHSRLRTMADSRNRERIVAASARDPSSNPLGKRDHLEAIRALHEESLAAITNAGALQEARKLKTWKSWVRWLKLESSDLPDENTSNLWE